MSEVIHKMICVELGLKEFQVTNCVDLLFKEECTIPFVARYRKEKTGSLDEVVLRNIRDRYLYLRELEANKIKYLKVVEEHSNKDPQIRRQLPEIRKKFLSCTTKQELEDLYLPFKPKRRTRAMIAKEKGLDVLAESIMVQRESLDDLLGLAANFINTSKPGIDAALQVKTAEEALAGASDVLAERFSETAEYRKLVRDISSRTGMLVSSAAPNAAKQAVLPSGPKNKKQKNNENKYENYYAYKESINTAPAHRIMAVRRGEAEKVLLVDIEVDEAQILEVLKREIVDTQKTCPAVKEWLAQVVSDCYKRLLKPSIETELRLALKARAEEDAIKVFATNLENLLLLSPLPERIVLGIDPGIRTGSKLAVVSATGKLLEFATIYPVVANAEDSNTKQAKEILAELITKHKVQYVACGNGTGGREIFRFVRSVLSERNLKDVKRLFVNEAGASVYSTDVIAREEFPDLDATIRSAVSIARRLQDPLAELVKIDPRSIGVGQYQHDVNVTKLKNSLEEIVESCVNRVGVNLNTASFSLLSYVSGVGPVLAKNIVEFRDKSGGYKSRDDLKRVNGFGPKVFQQAAGFLRVAGSENPLDNSAVHPERYEIVEQIAKDHNIQIQDLVGKKDLIDGLNFEKYVTASIGMPTLRDIASELIKPGRDPRDDNKRLEYSEDINEIEDLKPDMELKGTVTNVTNFGAFVDIGVHQDGLIHISELSDNFVKDPSTVVAVGNVINVRVLNVDLEKRRISLTCKSKQAPAPAREPDRPKEQRPRHAQHQNRHPQRQDNRSFAKHTPPPRPQEKKDPGPYRPKHSIEDLLTKFNKRPS